MSIEGNPGQRNTQESYTEEIPEQFRSNNPWVILGVQPGSSEEVTRRGMKELLKTYHPDISKHPQAEIIAKRINEAFSALRDKDGYMSDFEESNNTDDSNFNWEPMQAKSRSGQYNDFDWDSLRTPEDKPQEQKTASYSSGPKPGSEKYYDLKSAIQNGADYVKKFIEQKNLSEEQITSLMQQDENREILVKSVLSYMNKSGSSRSNEILKLLDGWQEFGVDPQSIIHTPMIIDLLKRQSAELLQNEILDNFKPDSSKFFQHIEDWENNVNLDLISVINEEPDKISEIASKKLNTSSELDFIAYVQSWLETGWVPTPEILNAYAEKRKNKAA